MSDDQTLAVRMTERLGVAVYSTAPQQLGVLGIKSLADRFEIASGVVLVQHLGWGVTMPIGTMGGALGPHRDITARDRFVASFTRICFRCGSGPTSWRRPCRPTGCSPIRTPGLRSSRRWPTASRCCSGPPRRRSGMAPGRRSTPGQ